MAEHQAKTIMATAHCAGITTGKKCSTYLGESPTIRNFSCSANQDISFLYWTRRNKFTTVFLLSLSWTRLLHYILLFLSDVIIPSMSRTPSWFSVEVILSHSEKRNTSASFSELSRLPFPLSYGWSPKKMSLYDDTIQKYRNWVWLCWFHLA